MPNMLKSNRFKGNTVDLIKLSWLEVALIFCVAASAAYAKPAQKPEFRFAAIISDNMVLQQQKKARIWGWARPGTNVVVTITEDKAVAQPYLQQETAKESPEYSVTVKYIEKNAPLFKAQTKKVKADSKGAWAVEFDAMAAGFTPKYIVAKTGNKGIAIKNDWRDMGVCRSEQYGVGRIQPPGA